MLCYELERSTKFFILVARFTSVKYVRTNFNYVTCNSLILGCGPRTGGSLGCAPGCDAGGHEFETSTGPTLRVFK